MPGITEWLRQRAADIRLRDEARGVARSRRATVRLRLRALAVWLVFAWRVRAGRHSDPPKWLSLPWHGHYCGPGNGAPEGETRPPIDALDAACEVHDRDYSRPP